MAHRGCVSINAHMTHPRFKGIFLDMGFKEEKVDLFVFSRFPECSRKFLRNRSNWFITSGDGDFEMET